MNDKAEDAARPFIPEDRTLLLVDDDAPFLTRLARAMESRGFEVTIANTVKDGKDLARAKSPPSRWSISGLKTAMVWMWWQRFRKHGPRRASSC